MVTVRSPDDKVDIADKETRLEKHLLITLERKAYDIKVTRPKNFLTTIIEYFDIYNIHASNIYHNL